MNGGAHFWTQQFLNTLGRPIVGVKVWHYAAGTSTPKDVWIDEGRSTPEANPVIGDSAGRVWFFADGDYRLRIEDNDGVLLYDFDNVRLTSDTATMWENDRGIAYPAAGVVNKGQLFALLDNAQRVLELAINDDGTGFHTIPAAVAVSTHAALPTPARVGRLRYLSDETRGLWVDTGTSWASLNGRTAIVTEFGAKGDGVTDDTDAIQAALDAVNDLGGGRVYFPAGIYVVTQVLVGSNTWLEGAGAGAAIIKSLSSSAINGMVTNKDTTAGNVALKVTGLHFVRSVVTHANENCCVLFTRCAGVLVQHCWFDVATDPDAAFLPGANNRGCWLRACNDVWVLDNQLTDCEAVAIAVTNGEGWSGYRGRALVAGNHITSSDSWPSVGVLLETDYGSAVDNVVICLPTNGQSCFAVKGTKNQTGMLVRDNDCRECGILFTAGSNLRITGNRIVSTLAGTGGIRLASSSGTIADVLVQGNLIEGGIGIALKRDTQVFRYPTVIANVVHDHLGDVTIAPGAISLIGVVLQATVRDNTVRDADNAGLYLSFISDAVVERNRISNCGGNPLDGDDKRICGVFGGGIITCRLVDNQVHDNPGYGYWFDSPGDDNDLRDLFAANNTKGLINYVNPTAGSAHPFGRVDLRGSGNPNGSIWGSRGSTWLRTDFLPILSGDNEQNVLYIKGAAAIGGNNRDNWLDVFARP